MTSSTLATSICLVAALTALASAKPNCRPGSYRSAAVCKPCPTGTYQWLPGQTSCTNCPANTYTSFTGVVDVTMCLPCRPDEYSAPGSSSCTACPAGQVANVYRGGCRKRTFRDPAACKPGYTRNASGVCVETLACPKGFVAPPDRPYFPVGVCVSGRTGCARFTNFYKWVRQPLCKSKGKVICQEGSRFDGKDRCLSCPTGMRQLYNEAEGRWQCDVCTGLSVSAGGLTAECTECKKGLYPSLDGAFCQKY